MSLHRLRHRQRLLIPEVVGTSAMDCGPASLKALLEGFGMPISYGRLREACQTDVDGTSIDALEQVSIQLGMDAEQVMTPKDHVLLPEARQLPALMVIVHPNGQLHFVVVWRRHGQRIQVMDSNSGRRWMKVDDLLKDAFVHRLPVPAEAWREWAGSDDFLRPLTARMRKLIGRSATSALIGKATTDESWHSLARLDAATRMTAALHEAGGIVAGREARSLVTDLFRNRDLEIPDHYWSASELPDNPEASEPFVLLRGAVLLRVRGVNSAAPETPPSPELTAAVSERPARPARQLLGQLLREGRWSIGLLFAALAMAAGGVLLEALLLRGSIEAFRYLTPWEQKLGAVAALLLIVVALTLLEFRLLSGLLRLGRTLETKLRVALLNKIPKLNDRYFQSRPISDMASRGHVMHQLRDLPVLLGEIARTALAIVLTATAICFLYPHAAIAAITAGVVALALPCFFHPRLSEQDLRVRTQAGALSRFYLDSLLGLAAVQAHVAERVMRREHESLLTEWFRTGWQMLRTTAAVETIQWVAGLALAGWVLAEHWTLGELSGGEVAGALLLAFWALQLPMLGGQLSRQLALFPLYRSTFLRLAEPLGAVEAESETDATALQVRERRGAELDFQDVSVVAAGHTILRDVNLNIQPGEHVAIVGASGAGKSTFAGLLLGWHRAAGGDVRWDGQSLDEAALPAAREQTAWIDPAVQLWNQSLLDNVRYGGASADQAGQAIAEADLLEVLERLPDGMRSSLGEGGGLLSGGEGQRVRLARAVGRKDARLVVLDEPFRGLERDRRQKMIRRLREHWSDSTLLFISHDIESTEEFPRVLVVDEGQIVEDDSPQTLAENAASHYHELLDSEREAQQNVWGNKMWRRLELRAGQLTTV